MRGRVNSFRPHGRHINDAFPGLWPLRFRRSQLKLRRQQFWCCQLFFNCPFYGGQAPPPACPASIPPSKPVHPLVVGANFTTLTPALRREFATLRLSFLSKSETLRWFLIWLGIRLESGLLSRIVTHSDVEMCYDFVTFFFFKFLPA